MTNDRRVILVVIGLTFFCYAEGWGADWRLFGKNDRADFYYDADSITRPPSKVIFRVWEKRIFTGKGVTDAVERSGFGEKYRSLGFVLGLSEFNCVDKQKRTLSLIWYSKDGESLSSDDASGSGWDFIARESMSERLYQILCKESQNEGKPGEDNRHSKTGDGVNNPTSTAIVGAWLRGQVDYAPNILDDVADGGETDALLARIW